MDPCCVAHSQFVALYLGIETNTVGFVHVVPFTVGPRSKRNLPGVTVLWIMLAMICAGSRLYVAEVSIDLG